jgi:hypothetical protein
MNSGFAPKMLLYGAFAVRLVLEPTARIDDWPAVPLKVRLLCQWTFTLPPWVSVSLIARLEE